MLKRHSQLSHSTKGRGPTNDIFPIITLKSWGSSSRLVFLKNFPTLVILGSDSTISYFQKYPATKSFFFDDDTFNIGRERLYKFAAEMKKRKIFIPWGMNARADYWDKELVRQLMDTGLFNLRIGIESGDPEILRLSGKHLDLDEAKKSLIMFKQQGLKNHLNFVIGLKGESMKSVENTIKFIKSVPVDSVQFTIAVPFPGTDYYKYLEKNDLLRTKDWDKYHAANTAVMDTIYMKAEEIEKAISYARKKIYFSPRFIFKRFAYIRNIRDANAILRKGLQLFSSKH